MNKELIKKYKKEFDYWMDGGNVLVFYKKDDEPKWWSDKESLDYDGDDNFSHIIANSLGLDDVLIVIDDEYVEFRKALAEGKVVQYYVDSFTGWQDVKSIKQPCMHPDSFRIKPEEPKFKVGDCVRSTRYFVSKQEPSKIKDKYSIKELIDLTEGQYGNLELKKYFKF